MFLYIIFFLIKVMNLMNNQGIVNQLFDNISDCDADFSKNLSTMEGLTLLQINARSIKGTSKFDKFMCFLARINFDIDLVVVGETCFAYDISCLRNIPNFIQYPACTLTKGGGQGG